MSMERILDNPDWYWDYDNMYVHPNIPPRKLEGALKSFATDVVADDVLVLLDDTIFGSAKEGLVLTRDGIYAREKFSAPSYIAIKDVRDISPDSDCQMNVNGVKFFKATIVEHFAILALAARMASLLDTGNSSAPNADEPSSPLDYYAVLGVRKSASRMEIDLAYKARRTQYHPDKYAGEAPDTIAWATAMMQQVNEAYSALTENAQ